MRRLGLDFERAPPGHKGVETRQMLIEQEALVLPAHLLDADLNLDAAQRCAGGEFAHQRSIVLGRGLNGVVAQSSA
ncbi:hypothetical protein J1614_011646 [Plenodomus biglobosus]|nr:hypothetical protein J1614_011646 [Plenodomus biglobosus]